MAILFYNSVFFRLSETFIYRQIKGAAKTYATFLLAPAFDNEQVYPVDATKITLTRYRNLVDSVTSRIAVKFFKLPFGISLFNYLHFKKLIKRNNIQLIHAHFGTNAVRILPLAKFSNVPLAVSFHGIDASPQYLKDLYYKNQLPELFDYAKAIFIVSPHMKETLELDKWAEKTHLIPYGIDPNDFTKQLSSVNTNVIKILHSGRLVAKKGVSDLIDVVIKLNANFNNLQLDIIGDGPLLKDCQDIVQEAGVKNIIFHGSQNQDVVKKYMADADIFVLNSRTSDEGDMEGLPNAILEAMSMQLPVISTYHAGISQAIINKENGLLVKERDNDGLRSALESLITDAGLRSRLGAEARKTVVQNFTIETMNTGIMDVYKTII